MPSFFRRLFGSKPREESRLRHAIQALHRDESPQTWQEVYDAFSGSSLVVALPDDQAHEADKLADRMRADGQITIVGVEEEHHQMTWSVFTEAEALQSWASFNQGFHALVPAEDVLWTASHNSLALHINPGSAIENQLTLNREEVAALGKGVFPTQAPHGLAEIDGLEFQAFEDRVSEATEDSIKRALVREESIREGYLFIARYGHQQPTPALGLIFDAGINMAAKNEACRRLAESGGFVFRGISGFAIIPFWESAQVERIHELGLLVYDRTASAALGFTDLPQATTWLIAQAAPIPNISKLESGPWLIDFGPDTLDHQPFLDRVAHFLEETKPHLVLWYLQGSAISSLDMDPRALQLWLHTISKLSDTSSSPQRLDIFIVKTATDNQKALAYLLLAMAKTVRQTGPNGEALIEIDLPEKVEIRWPGQLAQPLKEEQCFLINCHQHQKEEPGYLSTMAEERKAIAAIIAAPPSLSWVE